MRPNVGVSQSLIMTPQLQQAIKLLQMSNQELSSYLESEIEKNPLLEAGEENFEAPNESSSEAPAEAPAEDDRAMATDDAFDKGDASDQDWEDRASSSDGYKSEDDSASWNLSATSRSTGWNGADDELDQTSLMATTVSLREHLLRQMRFDGKDPAQRIIALTLLDQLDEAGYLKADLAATARLLSCSLEKIEGVLAELQKLEPTGVFARNLKECLALQLKEKGRFDPAMATMIDHLDLLAARDKEKLMRLCGVDAEDFADMVAEIRALNPKPALSFDHDTTPTVIPDVLMKAGANGAWNIELNQETLPRVLVNQSYLSQVQGKAVRKNDKDFLNDQLQSANWLVKALHQRATTILKVATEIVRQQDMFFQHGVEFLKPMTLRDIAAVIGMHESTVSRVTSNKYIATPRGMFELKYFFSVSIQGCSGLSNHSAESVRHRMRALIDAEGAKILSDDALVKLLKREGVDIARRTVAKYRESLHIPSSAQRRREKRIAL